MLKVHKAYREGFSPADLEVGPGLALVSPIRPPVQSSGIITSLATTELEGNRCLAYRIEALNATSPYSVGDVVLLRNALLDPIQPDLNLLVIKAEHIIAKVR